MKNTYGDADTEETTLYFESQKLRAELESEKAKSAEVVSVLKMILQIENNSGWGLNDRTDDSGRPYQSAHFAAILSKAEMIVSQNSTPPNTLYSSAPEMLDVLKVLYSNRPRTLRPDDLQHFVSWFCKAWEEDISILIKKASGGQNPADLDDF